MTIKEAIDTILELITLHAAEREGSDVTKEDRFNAVEKCFPALMFIAEDLKRLYGLEERKIPELEQENQNLNGELARLKQLMNDTQ